MSTRWDRAAPGFLEEWEPRFLPYATGFAAEIGLRPRDRVLVAGAASGAEAIAIGRAVRDGGSVRATEANAERAKVCAARARAAALEGVVTVQHAGLSDVAGGPFDVIACPFSLADTDDVAATLAAWRDALGEAGKIAIVAWGPADADDPAELLARAAHHVAPELDLSDAPLPTTRAELAELFERAELALVRHTVVRHTLVFRKAEHFVDALAAGSTWGPAFVGLAPATRDRLRARFCDLVGGPDQPLAYAPAATIAIAGRPGEELELPHRPSVRIPIARPSRPVGGS